MDFFSLTGYVNYLGRQGLAKVEEAEKPGSDYKDWWVTYIERDPAKLRKLVRKKRMFNPFYIISGREILKLFVHEGPKKTSISTCKTYICPPFQS